MQFRNPRAIEITSFVHLDTITTALVFLNCVDLRLVIKIVYYSCSRTFLSGQSLVVSNNPTIAGRNVMINCTTGDVVSGITLRFNDVQPSTNPKVTITSQMATYTIFTFANVTRSDNGLNISCTIEVGGNVRTLGHAILDVQCEFCVEIIGLLGL